MWESQSLVGFYSGSFLYRVSSLKSIRRFLYVPLHPTPVSLYTHFPRKHGGGGCVCVLGPFGTFQKSPSLWLHPVNYPRNRQNYWWVTDQSALRTPGDETSLVWTTHRKPRPVRTNSFRSTPGRSWNDTCVWRDSNTPLRLRQSPRDPVDSRHWSSVLYDYHDQVPGPRREPYPYSLPPTGPLVQDIPKWSRRNQQHNRSQEISLSWLSYIQISLHTLP